MRIRLLGRRVIIVVLTLAAIAATAPAPVAADPWGDDARWISMRFGYAKSGARFAGDGSVGYGFGYSRFINPSLAWSASVQYDLLGHYAGAQEIAVPITMDFTRHFRFSDEVRPYLGLGMGAVLHKTYRTGADQSGFRQALYLATGANGTLNEKSLLGFDVRLMIEQDSRSVNPVFPNKEASSVVWSAKLSYSRVL